MWDLKPFNIYTLCSQEKNYFFNVGFEGLSYIYSMFTRKNLHFSMWDLKYFSIYTLYFQEKNYFFNVEFEALSYIYILCSQEKSYIFSI
jgi:uncharacterized protein YfkK (UPF0435 family)